MVCTKRGDHCKTDFCYSSHYGKKYYTPGACKNLIENKNPCWLKSSELHEKDYLIYPINKLNKELEDFSNFVVSDKLIDGVIRTNKTKRGRPHGIENFTMNEDFLELCGWYVSEGCFDSISRIHFALNKKEEKEAVFIETQLQKLKLKTKRYYAKDTKSLSVSTSSVVLGRFFVDNFGSGAENKHIPEWIKNLGPQYLKYFLKGILKGDGSKNVGCTVINSASENLIYDLFDILLKFKCVSSLGNFEKPRLYKINGKVMRDYTEKLKGYSLSCSMSQNPELFNFIGFKAVASKKISIHGFFDEDNVYLPIRKISKSRYVGKVHNLEVKEDNSYIANGVTVHNCITATTAGLSKSAIVTSKYAGLITTVGDSGILLEGSSTSAEYLNKFTEEAIKLLKDEDYRRTWAEKAWNKMQMYSWDKIANGWIEQFNKFK